MNVTPTPWSNWSGYVKAQPSTCPQPATMEDLVAIIKTSPAPIRCVGSGHSFCPLVASDGTILSLDRFEGVRSHDPEKQTARVGAGTKIDALAKQLHSIGQALPNMGDIDKQALGGALGTATHGTGSALGAYHTQLEAIQIVDGRGEVRDFNRAVDPDAINAIGVSLGAFGALTEVTIQNIADYRLRHRRWTAPLKDALADFDRVMTAHRSSEFYYVPFSGEALMITSDITDAPVTSRPSTDDDDVLRTLRTLRNKLRRFSWLRRRLIASAFAKIPSEDYVEHWLNVYTTERNVKFNEMEYHLPFEEGAAVLAKIIALVETRFTDIYFPIEVRIVAPDEVWLSPFYKRLTCSIAIHHAADEDPLPYFHGAEPIFRAHGGRPHWGKMHTLKAADMKALYPRWDDAMAFRRDMDPDNRFVTPYVRGLLGIER